MELRSSSKHLELLEVGERLNTFLLSLNTCVDNPNVDSSAWGHQVALPECTLVGAQSPLSIMTQLVTYLEHFNNLDKQEMVAYFQRHHDIDKTELYRHANMILEFVYGHALNVCDAPEYQHRLTGCYVAKRLYHDVEHRLQFVRSIGIASDHNVWIAIDEVSGDEWIVKFQDEGMMVDIVKEIETNLWLSSYSVPLPRFDVHYKLFGMPVFVSERLVNPSPDSWVTLGTDILDQLQALHKIACHSDIKPDNIMYSPRTGKFTLIDFADISRDRFMYGFIRRAYTPLFTSQQEEQGQITTPRNDLFELVFTLRAILNNSNAEELKTVRMIPRMNPLRMVYHRVQQIDERHVVPQDYADMKALLLLWKDWARGMAPVYYAKMKGFYPLMEAANPE